MSDINEADLAALLEELRHQAANGYMTCQYAALRALVAERDALQEENIALRSRQKSHQDEVLDRVFEMDALREQLRLANIDQFNTEAEANDRERELRERLVCAALTGLCADPSFDGIVVRSAIAFADEALAAMRKGGGA